MGMKYRDWEKIHLWFFQSEANHTFQLKLTAALIYHLSVWCMMYANLFEYQLNIYYPQNAEDMNYYKIIYNIVC